MGKSELIRQAMQIYLTNSRNFGKDEFKMGQSFLIRQDVQLS